MKFVRPGVFTLLGGLMHATFSLANGNGVQVCVGLGFATFGAVLVSLPRGKNQ